MHDSDAGGGLIATSISGDSAQWRDRGVAVFTFAYVGKQLYEALLRRSRAWEHEAMERWAPAGRRHFWQRSATGAFRHIFPSACSAFEMSAMRQSWDM